MRRRNKTERRPDVAIVQKKLASLPLKVSAATQTNECHATTNGCHATTDGCDATMDGCHATTDRCHSMAAGCHMLTQECYDMTGRSPVEFPRVHSSSGRLDLSSSSCCSSCPDCLLSLPTSDLGLDDAADCHLFVFEDDFERLSEAEYQVDDDDDDADADQFIEFCFEETSRYLDEISHGSKNDRHPSDLRLELPPPPLLFPSAPGKIASGFREDSVGDMALVETGSSHNDSGIGRTTDESVKADDSSEQEMLENYFQPYRFHHSSGGNMSSAALAAFPLETTTLLNDVDANRKGMTSNFCQDLGEMSRDFEQMHLQSLVTTEAQQPNQRRNAITGQVENEPSGTFFPPPTPKQRIVPRMGTRRDFCRHARGVNAAAPCHDPFPLTLPGSFGNDGEVIWVRNTDWADGQTNPEMNSFLKMIATYQIPSDGLRSSDRNDSTMTSAYHTGNSSCCTPVFPQKATNHPPTASEQKKRPFPDGQPPSTPPHWKTKSSEVDPAAAVPTRTNTASQTTVDDCREQTSEMVPDACQLRSLQKLYTQYVDVMYTNHANLEHTIMVQQKLFSQQVQLNARKKTQRDTELKSSETQPTPHPIPASSSAADHCPEDQTPMEWVVKRRSDGSRYIARRPLRNQILKDRAQRLTEERSGVTTDDDAASEMKLGRYWSRDKRKVHLERARFHRQQKEMLQRQKMETVRENDADHHQPNIIELSRRKVMRHKSKKLLDGFTTVQELLAHGNAEPFGRSSNPLLSVTTV